MLPFRQVRQPNPLKYKANVNPAGIANRPIGLKKSTSYRQFAQLVVRVGNFRSTRAPFPNGMVGKAKAERCFRGGIHFSQGKWLWLTLSKTEHRYWALMPGFFLTGQGTWPFFPLSYTVHRYCSFTAFGFFLTGHAMWLWLALSKTVHRYFSFTAFDLSNVFWHGTVVHAAKALFGRKADNTKQSSIKPNIYFMEILPLHLPLFRDAAYNRQAPHHSRSNYSITYAVILSQKGNV